MGISLFNKGNERIAQGLNYDNFTMLANYADDHVRKGGSIGDRTIRLTKDGKGIATTTFSGSSGARVGQIENARKTFLDAVERKFGLNAREKAASMLTEEGRNVPLTSRLIKAINSEIIPGSNREQASRFVASQRAVFDRAIEDAVVSIAKQNPRAQFNIDPAEIERKAIALFRDETFPMTPQGLASAVAQAVAESSVVREGIVADEEEVRQTAQAAMSGVAKSAENAPIPAIRSQAEFVAFFTTLSVSSQYGSVQEDGTAEDASGEEKRTFAFNGIVFRSDDRAPDDATLRNGFESRNDLSVPKHRTEAMGLGTDEDGQVGSYGATGHSGISCARKADGAVGYLNPGGTFYVIDTRKLPAGEKAWDMEHTVYENGYKERENPTDDETKGEVCVSRIPRNAIIGWVKVSDMYMGQGEENNPKLETLQSRIGWDKKYSITFNPEYQP